MALLSLFKRPSKKLFRTLLKGLLRDFSKRVLKAFQMPSRAFQRPLKYLLVSGPLKCPSEAVILMSVKVPRNPKPEIAMSWQCSMNLESLITKSDCFFKDFQTIPTITPTWGPYKAVKGLIRPLNTSSSPWGLYKALKCLIRPLRPLWGP